MAHELGRILVPTDFSLASQHAQQLGRNLARRFDAQLHVLHVRVMPEGPDIDDDLLDQVETLLEPADQRATQRLLGLDPEEETSRYFGHKP